MDGPYENESLFILGFKYNIKKVETCGDFQKNVFTESDTYWILVAVWKDWRKSNFVEYIKVSTYIRHRDMYWMKSAISEKLKI